MANLTRETIDVLRSGALFNDDESIRIAGDLLAKAHNPTGYHSGFADTDAVVISEHDAEELRQVLIDLLTPTQDRDTVISILWALGKSNDKRNIELYARYLKEFADTVLWSRAGLFQVLCALNNIGQSVFERAERDGSDQDVRAIERNIRLARTYLEGMGIQLRT